MVLRGTLPPLTNARYRENTTRTRVQLKKPLGYTAKDSYRYRARKKMNELPSISHTDSKPKVVLFYKNGDRNFRGYHVTVTPRRFRNFDNLLNELTRVTNLPQGARFIFTPDSGNRIDNLEQLADGKSYVCGSFPKLKKINYGCAPDGSVRKCQVNRNFIPSQNSVKMKVENDRPPANVKPKIITIIRNGIGRPRKCVKVLLNKRTAQVYDQVLNDITSAVGVDGSSGVRKLFNTNGQLVMSLSELFGEEDVFIAVGSEKFRSSEIPYMLDELGLGKQQRKNKPKSVPLPPTKRSTPKTTPDKRPTEIRTLKKLPDIKKKEKEVIIKNVEENKKMKSSVRENLKEGAEKVTVDSIDHIVFSDNEIENVEEDNGGNANAKNMPKNQDSTVVAYVQSPVSSTKLSSTSENEKSSKSSKSTISIKSTKSSKSENSSISSSTNVSEMKKVIIDVVENDENNNQSNVNVNPDISHVDLESDNSSLETDDEEDKDVVDRVGVNKDIEEKVINSGDDDEDDSDHVDSKDHDDIDSEDNADSDIESSSTDTVTVQTTHSSNSKLHSVKSPLLNYLVAKRGVTRISERIDTSEKLFELYDFEKKLGDGNFAVVKEGVEKETGEKYAIKIIDGAKIKGKDALLRNEIKIQQECFHPNIVQLYHDYHSPTEIFLVMELISGGDFFDLVAQNVKFEEEEAAGYVRDLCSGLDYLHQRNIVHRDIKPENLMVYETSGGQQIIKLADFGLAMKVTQPIFTICGTPTYVSPEILMEKGYGLEVDMWAAGVIIYIMLCGFPPFRSPNRQQTELFDMIEAGEFEFLEPYWDDVSDLAKDLINNILVVNVDNRFKSSQVFSHPWLEQYNLSRNNTMERSPKKKNRFRTMAKGVQSLQRMKFLLDLKLQRGENFITHVSSHASSQSHQDT